MGKKSQVELRGRNLPGQFENLINDIANTKNTQVVLLFDKYDKLILGNILDSRRGEFLNILKSFYFCIKKWELYR